MNDITANPRTTAPPVNTRRKVIERNPRVIAAGDVDLMFNSWVTFSVSLAGDDVTCAVHVV